MQKDMLIEGRESLPHLLFTQAIQVNHHEAPAALGEITSVQVWPNMTIKVVDFPEAKGCGNRWRHQKSRSMKLHTGIGQVLV